MPTVLLLHGVQSSSTTWWRAVSDLTDLGWEVLAPDLLGHGTRAHDGPAVLTVEVLADDVAAGLAAPVDLVVGHSLGAIVALVLAGRHPDLVRAVVLEDPPGLAGGVDPRQVADEIEADAAAARNDPTGVRARLLADEPEWATVDAGNAVANRAGMDAERVAASFRSSAAWDLPALVAASPSPVTVIAADGPGTALTGVDREALRAALPSERFVGIPSGHGVHRDRPALWLRAVLAAAGA